MTVNRKMDNDKITLFPDGTLHLHDNLHEVTSGEDNHIEYEGDLYITHTDLTLAEVEVQFDGLIAVEREKWRKQVAREEARKAKAYLDSTDWICAKCVELGLAPKERYPEICAKREEARAVLRA